MNDSQIASAVDHTLLRQDAAWTEIKQLCDEAVEYGAASVCIPPSYVGRACKHVDGKIPVCTVIGFPNGYSTTRVKCYEAKQTVADGAAEVDMVVNLGWVKDGKWSDLLTEIRAVKQAVGERVLKVIVETCLLTDSEKIKLCEIVGESGADYIKTSTGFASGGATEEDVSLFAQHVPPHLKIKASGGIGSLEDAARFLELGASRLGTSKVIKLLIERDRAAAPGQEEEIRPLGEDAPDEDGED